MVTRRRRHDAPEMTTELRFEVFAADGGCVAPIIDPDAGPCRDRWGDVVPRGRISALEANHVHRSIAENGTSLRAANSRRTLVTLCAWHHRGQGGLWEARHRQDQRDYIARREARLEGATA